MNNIFMWCLCAVVSGAFDLPSPIPGGTGRGKTLDTVMPPWPVARSLGHRHNPIQANWGVVEIMKTWYDRDD